MCLDFVLELPIERSRGTVSARRLADVSGLYVASLRMPSGNRGFQFCQGGKGCSCSLLGSDFEIQATSWPLDAGVGAALSRAISLVATLSPVFVLDSTYAGREPEPERVSTTLAAVLEELSLNRLSAHVIREVRVAPA